MSRLRCCVVGGGILGAAVARRLQHAADGLVDDFRISTIGRVLALRNAPSLAATAALAIAEHVVASILGRVA